MRILTLTLALLMAVPVQAISVYDGARHATDIIDNVQDLVDQVNQIQNQVQQIQRLSEQISQMNDYLDRLGKAERVILKADKLVTRDLVELGEEIKEYTDGLGLTGDEEQENTELYGDINKEEHSKENEVEPEDEYTKHENVEKEFAAYKKTSDSTSQMRLEIVAQLEELGSDLNNAKTDQEVQKINSSINAHKLMLSALKDEEERQYRSFQAELRRNENAQAKELTRYEQRKRFLDEVSRTRREVYKLSRSAKILGLIEGN